MKVKPSVKPRCGQCYFVLRRRKLRIQCRSTRRHNQVQG